MMSEQALPEIHCMPRFRTLHDVRALLETIDLSNIQTTGDWDACQIFYHLASAFELSCKPGPSGTLMHRLMKLPMRLVIMHWGIPKNIPIPETVTKQLIPPQNTDAAEQLERLLRSIEIGRAHV